MKLQSNNILTYKIIINNILTNNNSNESFMKFKQENQIFKQFKTEEIKKIILEKEELKKKLETEEKNKKEKKLKSTQKKKFKPENYRIKIKVHFHKFIFSFFKDLIKAKFPKKKCKLRKIPHSITRTISKDKNKILINMKLEEFLSQEVSSTFKCDSNENQKNIQKLKKLIGDSDEKKYLEMTYKDFYIKYYLSKDKSIFNIPLSSSTQFFYEYIDSLNEKDRNIIEMIGKKYFIQYFLDNNEFYIEKKNNLNINNGYMFFVNK